MWNNSLEISFVLVVGTNSRSSLREAVRSDPILIKISHSVATLKFDSYGENNGK
jgi:hypothetical protein